MDTRSPYQPDDANNLLREHFGADGLPKVLRSQSSAIEYAQEFDLAAYECSFCGWWHVGNRSE